MRPTGRVADFGRYGRCFYLLTLGDNDMTTYESPLANKFGRLARLGRFGFLGFLGFLGCLGFIPGCERLFGLSGLSGLGGLFGFLGFYGLAQIVERRYQRGVSHA